MKVFTRDYRTTGDFPAAYSKYFDGMRYCVLDIETTGLHRENSKVILVGLLMETDSGIRITQFLAENHYEEYKVLDAVLEYLEEEHADYLITYNGAAFDLPFLNARLDANFSGCSISMYDFDLYRFIRTGTDLKSRIGSLNQKSVENYYGILEDRGDTISGRESVTMFDEYSLTGNSTLEKIILTHNREDVLHLHRLMHLALVDVEDMESALASYGIPIMGGDYSIRPEIKKAGRGASAGWKLRICGDQLAKPFSSAFFPDQDSPVYASFNASTRMFEIEVPVSNAAGFDGMPYLDLKPLGLDSGQSQFPFDLRNDPDYVNGFLILNPRTINLIGRLLTESIILKNSK